MSTGAGPFRFGLIGCRWGLNYLRTIARHPEWAAPVVARASGQPLPEPFAHIPVTADWAAWARGVPPVDAVLIATPPYTHRAIALPFIERGVPVLIEKPLSVDPADAAAIVEAARRCGVTVWVDHTHLFHPAFRAMKERVSGHRITALRAGAGNVGPFRTDTTPYWDWLPHDVAMMIDLAGALPERVEAELVERRTLEQGNGETHVLRMVFQSGLVGATRITNMELPKHRWMEVEAEGVCYRYDSLAEHALVQRPAASADDAAWTRVPFDSRLPLEVLLAEFVGAVRRGDTRNESLTLGAAVVGLLARGAVS